MTLEDRIDREVSKNPEDGMDPGALVCQHGQFAIFQWFDCQGRTKYDVWKGSNLVAGSYDLIDSAWEYIHLHEVIDEDIPFA